MKICVDNPGNVQKLAEKKELEKEANYVFSLPFECLRSELRHRDFCSSLKIFLLLQMCYFSFNLIIFKLSDSIHLCINLNLLSF